MDTPLIRARRLRHDMPPAERAVWAVLRGRGLAGWKFRRQVPVGPYICDFLCAECRVVLELDGDSHAGRETYDQRRDDYLRTRGYRVLRVNNTDVADNLEGVMTWLKSQLGARKSPLT